MRKLYTMLTAALVAAGLGATAAPAHPTLATAKANSQKTERAQRLTRSAAQAKGLDVTPLKAKKSAARHIAAPEDVYFMTDQPEGDLKVYTKRGLSYVYNWLFGLMLQSADGSITEIVTADDGSVYMNNPIAGLPSQAWVKGKVEGDKYIFELPAQVAHEEYDYGDGEVEVYDDYCVKLEYQEDEDGGWYYPCEDQTFTFTLQADGSLLPESSELMLGDCMWLDDEDGNFSYSWQGTGDFVESLVPLTDKLLEVPATAQFENWYLLAGGGVREMPVAIDGNNVYLKNVYTEEDTAESAIVGTISEDGKTVTFKSGQYLGEWWEYMTVLYFDGVKVVQEYDPDYDEYYDTYEFLPELTFAYDAEKKTLKSENAWVISTSPTSISYYEDVVEPIIKWQNPDFTVTALPDPVIDYFYDAMPEYGYCAEVYFDFPRYDADNNVLPADKLFWNLILDNEVFEFFPDEYTDLTEPMTDVPYGFSSDYEFSAAGSQHGCYVYPEGFESLGVRTGYKDGDKVIYSNIAWVEGYAAIKGIEAGNAVSSKYYDLNGIEVSRPANGIFVRRSVMENGQVVTSKVIKR